MRVLIIDDDAGVRRFLERTLEIHGVAGDSVNQPAEAYDLLARNAYDAILLDVSMPGESGWQFLETLRGKGDDTPVIFLTAHHTLEERVRGLRLGADDYVAKPFEPDELVARLEAVLRRRQTKLDFTVGPLRVDLGRRVVEVGGERVDLSPREFDVLGELLRARGRVISKSELLKSIWGIDFDPGTKVVEVQVARLRRKLSRAGVNPIQTLVGEGYRLAREDGDGKG